MELVENEVKTKAVPVHVQLEVTAAMGSASSSGLKLEVCQKHDDVNNYSKEADGDKFCNYSFKLYKESSRLASGC